MLFPLFFTLCLGLVQCYILGIYAYKAVSLVWLLKVTLYVYLPHLLRTLQFILQMCKESYCLLSN